MKRSDNTARKKITLREITAETVREICSLNVHENQTGFVAPNGASIAQAHFSEKAWFRAIYAGETPVGFAMLEVNSEKPEYYLWRFMIDSRYQGKGYGLEAMKLLIEHVKTLPDATEFLTSVVQADGGPQAFYEKLGFTLTGEYDDGEAMMKFDLGG